jgi:hypothetical protein
VSLLPYFFGPAAPLRTRNYAEIFVPNFTPDPLTGGPPAGYVGQRHDQALRDERFKLIRKSRRLHIGGIVVTEEFYDLDFSGPTPDWFEGTNLLATGAPPLSPEAALALTTLRSELTLNYPTLMF